MNLRIKLGELLVKEKVINDSQLKAGLAYQRQMGVQLGEALIILGIITEKKLLTLLSQQFKLPAVNLATTTISDETLKLVNAEFAQKNHIIPLGIRNPKGKEKLLVATADPTNFTLHDELRILVNKRIVFVIATKSSIRKAIRKFYFNEHVDFREGKSGKNEFSDEDFILLKSDEAHFIDDLDSSDKFSSASESEDGETSKIKILRTSEEDEEETEKNQVGKLIEIIGEEQARDESAYAETIEIQRRKDLKRQFQALLKLLINKGVISRAEFDEELHRTV